MQDQITAEVKPVDASDLWGWTAWEEPEIVEPLEPAIAWMEFVQLAEKLGGKAEEGKFSGTIQVDPTVEDVAYSERCYEIIKMFCYTASVSPTWRKGGGVSLRIVVGERRPKQEIEACLAIGGSLAKPIAV